MVLNNCFVCNTFVNKAERVNLFVENQNLNRRLPDILSEIFDRKLPETGLHSTVLCVKCFKTCVDYENHQEKIKQIKTQLLNSFKETLPKHGQTFTNYPKKSLKPLVVPASKLQPLPPNYVINVAGLTKLSPTKVNLGKDGKPNFQNLNINASTSLLTQNAKVVPKPATKSNISTVTSNSNIIITNVESIKKENSFVKIKCEDNLKEDSSMEIDGDNTEEQETKTDSNGESMEDKQIQKQEKSHYFDVSLLSEGATNDTILGKLEILDQSGDDENEESETIVMTGENGSILRIMSGKKLVYENGEITLASDDENSNDNQDNVNDGQDSNDESQIELQVSGDEETANAIIAAAQEQGGAFIKVGTGEMFRVQSVHSKSGDVTEDTANTMVAQTSPGSSTFKCLLCEKSEQNPKSITGDPNSMMQHIKLVHAARLYICELCRKVMRRRSEYTAHLEEHSMAMSNATGSVEVKTKLHECTLCHKKYNSRTLLQEHMNIHNGTRPYSCNICNKAFASKYTHQAHLKTHLERPRPFKCNQCPKSFFTQQNLNQHQKTHLGIKDFVCNTCGKAFGSQHNLEVHSVVHSGKKAFVCGVCGKGFARKAEVKDHMRIHTGERPYTCDICGAAFSQRSNLHSHKRATHLDDRRYHCTECPKKFKRRRLLDYHMKASHTGVRPLVCEVCQASFVYPEHYKKHIRIHSGEKPYVCEVCGKSFNSRDNRNTHRFVHSDKKPYECLVCGSGYMRKQLLYAHMNTSGHIAESIVVNQPRVQNIKPKASVDVQIKTTDNIEKGLDTIQEFTFVDSNNEASSSEQANAPKLFLTEDKKLVLQDGKSTINLVPETDDPALLSFIQNLEGAGGSSDANLQSISAEQLGEQVQVITTDENGEIKLVKLHINSNIPGPWSLSEE